MQQEYKLLIVDEEESEDMEKDKAPVAVSEPFNSDQCVVCLLKKKKKKTELLFINCLHRCVCLECEKNESITQMPIVQN